MKRLNKAALVLVAANVLCSGVAQAALIDRGGGLVYDDVLNITWLQDANYAKTSGYDSDGRMNWGETNAWAAALSYGGYDDWRLPTALNQDGSGPCFGYCSSSEMGHMFYNNMGASADVSILSGTNSANLALFANLKSDVYWSGTAYAPNPAIYAWYFWTARGRQDFGGHGTEFYAWAVRPGDVAPAVPEPETYALLLAGLGAFGVVAKQRGRSCGAS